MKLDGQVALITGAGSGFGRVTAYRFAQEGASIVLTDINREALEETHRQIVSAGCRSCVVMADVSQIADAERMIQSAVTTYGRLDILFNNAGVGMAARPAEEVTEELWQHILGVNLHGVFFGCKYAIPVMKEQGGGVILNTASIGGVRPRIGSLPYATSKGAVITLTQALALELAPYRIRVNCLAPVSADTPMFRGVIEGQEASLESRIAAIPLGRLATPDDVAKAALYLVSADSDMITGTCLPVDGGRGL